MDAGFYVAVDTNVFIDSLEGLKGASRILNPMNIKFLVPWVVTRELDSLKTTRKSARDALKFIEEESNRINAKVKVEPQTNLKCDQNDDSIAVTCQMNKIYLLLSNDRALRIKVQAYGIPAISTYGKSPEKLAREIKENLGSIDFMEFEIHEDTVTPHQSMQASVAEAIYVQKIVPTMKKEIGEDLVSFYMPQEARSSLSLLIRQVVKHFSLFSSILPVTSKRILQKISGADISYEDAERLFLIFGLEIPSWFRNLQY